MNKKITASVGDKFETRTITAILLPTEGSGHARYLMRCDCGHETVFRNPTMRRQCRNCQRYAGWKKRNGESKSPLYNSWHSMLHRCSRVKPTDRNYRNYVGKGIKVCDEWKDWEVFKAWALANGYAPNLTIDRINPDKDYEPSNCQWVTRSENGRRRHEDWRRHHTPIEMLWGHC